MSNPLPLDAAARAELARKASVRYVAQDDPMGCGVACLAMVSGRTYAEVRADINPMQVERGLADQTVLWWLNRHGFWHRRSWMDGEWGYPVPTSGVALMLTHDAHWVVLADGVVLDPARPTPLPQYDFRQAIEVQSPDVILALLAAVERGEAETARLDFLEAFCDDLAFYHSRGGEPEPVLSWFAGDGDSVTQTQGPTWRAAIDAAMADASPDAARAHPPNPGDGRRCLTEPSSTC